MLILQRGDWDRLSVLVKSDFKESCASALKTSHQTKQTSMPNPKDGVGGNVYTVWCRCSTISLFQSWTISNVYFWLLYSWSSRTTDTRRVDYSLLVDKKLSNSNIGKVNFLDNISQNATVRMPRWVVLGVIIANNNFSYVSYEAGSCITILLITLSCWGSLRLAVVQDRDPSLKMMQISTCITIFRPGCSGSVG